MNFIQEYIFEIEISDSDEITISKGTTEVTLKDYGSKCQHLCDGYSKEKKNTQRKPRNREVVVVENILFYVRKILSI